MDLIIGSIVRVLEKYDNDNADLFGDYIEEVLGREPTKPELKKLYFDLKNHEIIREIICYGLDSYANDNNSDSDTD